MLRETGVLSGLGILYTIAEVIDEAIQWLEEKADFAV